MESTPPHAPAGSGTLACVAFDLDGVLVDSESINLRSATLTFKEFGCPLEAADAARVVGRHPMDYLPELARRFDLNTDAQQEMRRFQEGVYRQLWEEAVEALPGVPDVLFQLRDRGLRLALATSAGRRHAEHCVGRFGLESVFEFVVAAEDVTSRKPDPEVYLASARRFDVQPSRMLAVEDSEFGVRAAKAAGARCVAVRSAHVASEKLAMADRQVESLLELPGVLDAGIGGRA